MRKSAKIITALSVSGLAVVAGSAFTGAGLTNNAGATQFIGGTVSQSVTGATLSNLQYTFADPAKRDVQLVTLTFANGSAAGKNVDVVLTNEAGTNFPTACEQDDADNNKFTCEYALETLDIKSASVTVS
jgi:hypothetical protein